MTLKSDFDHNQSPDEQPNDDWEKLKPRKKKCELTPQERADFDTAIYRSHDGLVKKWIRQFVPSWLLEPIDEAQLKLDVLDELISAIWEILEADKDIDANFLAVALPTIFRRRSIWRTVDR